MSHYRLFLLPEGPLFERQFITKEAACVFIRDNLFFKAEPDKFIVAPDERSWIPEEYIEIERCLIDIVEVE